MNQDDRQARMLAREKIRIEYERKRQAAIRKCSEQAHQQLADIDLLWQWYKGEVAFPQPVKRPNFTFSHPRLCEWGAQDNLRQCRRRSPTASAFADWVYLIDHWFTQRSFDQRLRALQRGREIERLIREQDDQRLLDERKLKSIDHQALLVPEWGLAYADPLSDDVTYFEAPALRLDGIPMRGRPDLVFRHIATGDIVIVERKATKAMVFPKSGWANLKAQLWVYAHLEPWCLAPRIILIGEAWSLDFGIPIRRHLWRWETSNERFMQEQRELFDLFVHA